MPSQMERVRYKIYETFMCVPLQVIKRLQRQAEKRRGDMERQIDEDSDGVPPADNHDADADADNTHDQYDDAEVDWSTVVYTGFKRRHMLRDRKSSMQLCLTLSFPLLVCLVSALQPHSQRTIAHHAGR